MQPNTPPPQSNPYDFILQPPQPPKRSLLSGGGLAKRLLIVVGLGAIFIILIIVVLSLILGKSGPDIQALKSLTARQQEIIRVSEAGSTQARTSSVVNTTATAVLSLRTDQKALAAYVKQQGVSDKELSAGLNTFKSTDTDEKLKSALTNNNYDEVFTDIMIDMIQTYQAKLKESYESSSSTTLRTLLNTQYSNAELLLRSLSPAS